MMPVDFEITYGYLADLCAACDWNLALEREADGRFALRVYLERAPLRERLAGARFTSIASLDAVAEVVFGVLSTEGLV